MADEVFDIDLDNLKIREISLIETMIGGPIDEAFAAGKPRGKALQAIACVVKQRVDPTFTFDQAGELVIRLTDGVDPTSAVA